MNLEEKLFFLFKKFPGIGEKQARRFLFFLINSDKKYLEELINLIKEIKEKAIECEWCFRFFLKLNEENLCPICNSLKTDKSLITIVEKDSDIEPLKKAGLNGVFFVLNCQGKEINNERVKKLLSLIEKTKDLKEIIIATSATSFGEYLKSFLKSILYESQKKYGFKISSLGKGVSTGTEIEYTDVETLKEALGNRK